MPNPLDTNRIK